MYIGVASMNVTDAAGNFIPYTANKVKNIQYNVLEGSNQEVEYGNVATFKVDADMANFRGVYVNEELLDSTSYTVNPGATIITLNKEFIESLALGNHEIVVSFTNGQASTTFNVIDTLQVGGSLSAPNTGDSTTAITYIMLFVVAACAFALTVKKVISMYL